MWYEGDISEAVAKAKKSNACLVVFIEGQSETSKHLESLFNKDIIIKYLDTPQFVCIRFLQDTSAYVNFAAIYKFVPVPSVFFLNENGQPLEIGTELMQNVEELEVKIVKVLNLLGNKSESSTATTTTTTTSAATTENAEQTASTSATATATNSELCEGGACALPAVAKVLSSTNVEATTSFEGTKKTEKPKVVPSESFSELEKLREAKEREQHLREMREKLRHDKMIEQAARERVRAQIAADRRERAEIKSIVNNNAENTAPVTKADVNVTCEATTKSNVVRLQFRMGNGNNVTHNFETTTTLGVVREYVRSELLANTKGRENFTLATTYPKRDLGIEHDEETLYDLSLSPSAVILVIVTESAHSSAVMRKHFDNVWTITRTIFVALVSPLVGIAGYLGSFIGLQGQQNGNTSGKADDVGQAKKDDKVSDAAFLDARRRNAAAAAADKFTASATNVESGVNRRRWAGESNIHRIRDQQRDDDNEDNATWNGNSTQQQ